MTTTPSSAPPTISPESVFSIAQRQCNHTDSVAESAWTQRYEAHCQAMAAMSNDARIEYLRTAGCHDDAVATITKAVAESLGNAGKTSLRSAARKCAEANKDIEQLLQDWPERKHSQLLNSNFAGLNEEQISLARAYAACQIYEMAATALYLVIVDGMSPVISDKPSDPATTARDKAIAEAGYTCELSQWPT